MAWLIAGLLTTHFLGDFTALATARMQEAKATGSAPGWVAAHGAVHGILSTPLLLMFASSGSAFSYAAIVAASHFAIDMARSRLGVRFEILTDPTARPFWTAVGFDQLLHGLVIVWVASQAA